jgi:hypothetical protein
VKLEEYVARRALDQRGATRVESFDGFGSVTARFATEALARFGRVLDASSRAPALTGTLDD